ncbi:hypothetical protein CDAR_54361 [Caerostris darwini]|uniref:Uncharacterized protein n=1 Tax=Caerostris darwini TaxID=1538125 RepID=A0AAV4PP37_9ARAC|nr:hypothetical protein CDAR_54361 [Caerostris darwini]
MTDSWKTISHFVSVSKSLLGTFPKVRTKLAIRYLRMKLSEILCEPSRIEREEDGLFVIEGYSKHIVGSKKWERKCQVSISLNNNCQNHFREMVLYFYEIIWMAFFF